MPGSLPFVLHGAMRSPFVRRVAIWLRIYGIEHSHVVPQVFGADFDSVRAISPLSRVPALSVGAENLIETSSIIDFLEEYAAAPSPLIPQSGEARRNCLQGIAVGSGVADKAVALVYERDRRPAEKVWDQWIARLEAQIIGGMDALDKMVPDTGWMGGDAPDGSDVTSICSYDYLAVTSPHLVKDRAPRLAGLSAQAASLPAFSETHPPAR